MTRVVLAVALLAAGCSQSSDCPVPVDGGGPSGSCNDGSASCELWTNEIVPGTGGCSVGTEYRCTCLAGEWSCAIESSDHHVCEYADGGMAF